MSDITLLDIFVATYTTPLSQVLNAVLTLVVLVFFGWWGWHIGVVCFEFSKLGLSMARKRVRAALRLPRE